MRSTYYLSSFPTKPRKVFKKTYTKPLVNYQVKGSNSDSENKPSLSPSPEGFNQSPSYSTLASGSDEERSEKREFSKARIMFEGHVIQNSDDRDVENALTHKQTKFQDACEKIGPNPKHISLPWFV